MLCGDRCPALLPGILADLGKTVQSQQCPMFLAAPLMSEISGKLNLTA